MRGAEPTAWQSCHGSGCLENGTFTVHRGSLRLLSLLAEYQAFFWRCLFIRRAPGNTLSALRASVVVL